MRRILLLLGLLSMGSLHAQGDPLKSDACGAGLQALQSARSEGRADVEALRRAATQACLGGSGDARRPSPTAQAPIVVPPPVIESGPRPKLAETPPPVYTPPAVITHCDIGGCWDSSGRHLPRVGPNVVSPAGTACVPSGLAVVCP
ncbi:hypothetical protein [Ramlibacter algicola]|uniref:Uncharacterized protein n=1 Tax=Ramlibacter algicola TaxID=2795217 RepID=A0A934URX0_9BURK|nr:hypothetical protein [Ramlibacter algicola]MBK0393266.1 hypothetical protein [Ramlibacter algicola]